MKIRKTNHLDSEQKLAALSLWNNEYPRQLAYPSIGAFNTYLADLLNPMHYLLITNEDLIGGWAFTFTRDERQWFAIIVNGLYQKQGFGSELLTELKKDNTLLHGWVTDHDNYVRADGSKYTSPLSFYLKNEFELVASERFENSQLSAVKISYDI